MSASADVIVLKFGSSVLRTAADLPGAVHEIYRYVRDGLSVVAVVSAFEGVTDRLLARARELGADPDLGVGVSGLASLVASGERETAAALQIVLSRAGLRASVVDPLAANLVVNGDGLEGEPVSLDAERLRRTLQEGAVTIVPGFFGVDDAGSVSLLGRGGSDWTAIFLAQQLGARCRLLKDTDGIYERDPNATAGRPALRFVRLSYDDAVALEAPVVQNTALVFARDHKQTFEVARIGSSGGTSVGPLTTLIARDPDTKQPPLRVALLGLGAVGRGVYEHLSRETEHFELTAVAVRDRDRHAKAGIPTALLCSIDEALERPCDLLIEAIGGIEDAGRALEHALSKGRDAVSANKAVIAARGERLREIASRHNARLAFSAAVGGVIPVLETLRGLRTPVEKVEGVLNGTSNFVLERRAAGESLEAAIADAKRLGYAEADPTEDLSGLDTARKLTLIARTAFEADIEAEAIPRPPESAGHGNVGSGATRFIGRVRATSQGVVAEVAHEHVPGDHPFARCPGASNAVLITLRNGRTITLRGLGASRWPTAESVMGDVFEIARARRTHVEPSRTLLGQCEGRAS